jgi:phospholipid-binding lipoprotein MlaA
MTQPILRIAAIWLSLLFIAGCATAPRDPAARAEFKANNDPIEPFNRRVFAFNLGLDKVLIRPVAKTYVWAVPRPARNGIRHFLDNLNEPLVFANCVLQGRFQSSVTTAGRLVFNSIVGLGGIFDPASRHNMPQQIGDFGQTLWAWHVPEGPYVIIPVVGPSTPRDVTGRAVDIYIDPFRYVPAKYNYPDEVTTGRLVADGIDQRARYLDALDEIQRESIDYYAAFRSFYRQNRAAELRNNKPSPTALPPANFYDDPGR